MMRLRAFSRRCIFAGSVNGKKKGIGVFLYLFVGWLVGWMAGSLAHGLVQLHESADGERIFERGVVWFGVAMKVDTSNNDVVAVLIPDVLVFF